MEKEKKSTAAPINAPIFEHIYVRISMAKKRWSEPKLYIPRKNCRPSITSRWYVSFYWRSDPEGPLDKKFTFAGGINRLETSGERKVAGKALADAYKDALERGWNPDTKKTERKKVDRHKMMLGEALDYAFQIKTKTKKGSTLIGYEATDVRK